MSMLVHVGKVGCQKWPKSCPRGLWMSPYHDSHYIQFWTTGARHPSFNVPPLSGNRLGHPSCKSLKGGPASSRVAWVSTPLLVVVRQDLRDHLDRRHNSSHTSQAYSNPYLSKMVLPRMLPSFFEGPTRLSSSLSSKARPEPGASLERVPRVLGTCGYWKHMF